MDREEAIALGDTLDSDLTSFQTIVTHLRSVSKDMKSFVGWDARRLDALVSTPQRLYMSENLLLRSTAEMQDSLDAQMQLLIGFTAAFHSLVYVLADCH